MLPKFPCSGLLVGKSLIPRIVLTVGELDVIPNIRTNFGSDKAAG